MRSVQRVLIIGPSNIGDAVLAGDVITAIRTRFLGAHLTLVVGARARALFVDDARIQTVVDADAFSSFTRRLRLAAALWRYRPQAVVDLRHTLYPLVLRPLTFWKYLRTPPKTVVHMRDRHLWHMRTQVPGSAAGAEPGQLWRSERDVAQVAQLRRRWALEERRPLVLLCPGARSHIKRWMGEGFAALGDRLASELGAHVVFTGEPAEEAIIEEIRGLMRHHTHSAVGLLTVRQLGVLMEQAHLVITNDSASLHLASAVQAPTVAIFGPTDERAYGPTSARSRVIRRRLFCAPCEQALCRFSHECMRFIPAEEVYRAATDLLAAQHIQGQHT